MNNIFKQISSEVHEFNTEQVTIIDKFNFRQRDTIEKIIRLYNSKFKDGQYDKEGFRKYFKNIVRNPCQAAMKAIKFTPKDILIVAAPGQNENIARYMDRDFRHYLKEKQFNKILNRLFVELPIFGSVVLKKVRDEFHFVDLRNLINEQAADKLKDASYVIEQHYYSPHELRKKKWDNVEEVISKWRGTKQPYIRVFERYGEVPESEFGGDPNKYVYSRYIVYMPSNEYDDRIQADTAGIILDKTKLSVDEFPYREFHWEKIPGRWLGVGRVELLTDPQVRTNEIINLRVKSSYVAGLNIWQTRDDNVKKNLIKDIGQGQVITAMDRIERIPTEDRNTFPFTEEEQGWIGNRDEVSFTYDVVRGERMPAGTPLGSAQMAAQMITSYFEHIREAIASDFKELIYNDILSNFKNNDTHYVKLIGEDLDWYRELEEGHRLNDEIIKFFKRTKKVPSDVQKQAMLSGIKQKLKTKGGDVIIPKKFYDKVKYSVDIVITGQDRDVRVQAANMAMILQTMIADPTILTDPAKRKVFGKQLEAVGLSVDEISPTSQDSQQVINEKVGQQKGGGISRPNLPQNLTPNI